MQRSLHASLRLCFIACIFSTGFFVTASTVQAATKTWDGEGGDSNCSTGANWSGDTAPSSGDDAVFDGTSTNDATWDGGCPSTINSLSVNSGYTGTISLSSSLTVSTNLTVDAGTLQTGKDTTSTITVTNTFSIGSSGTVVVRRSSTSGNGAGQTIVAGTLTITGTLNADGQGFDEQSGPGFQAGGDTRSTHGGAGANNTLPTYGSISNPTSLGSGGSSCCDPDEDGGGAIIISSTGTVTVDGTLSANAHSGFRPGAGGSLNITAQTLTGTGTIQANGGSSGLKSGSGGRISLNGVTTDTFSGALQVLPVNGGDPYKSHAGTIYLNAAKRSSLTIGGAGNLSSLTLGSDGTNNYTFGSITIQNGGTLAVDGNPTMNASKGGAATLSVTSLDVQSGGTLSADYKGFQSLSGPSASAAGEGATYGGEGSGNTDLTYGSITNPTSLGSGGSACCGLESGGGAVIISSSGAVTVNGEITADGQDVDRGGGSGGTINISATTISGSGTVSANGGDRAGGGRMAVALSSGTTFGSVVFQAYGGTETGVTGAAGTIYLQDANDGAGKGELIINNNNVSTASGIDTVISSSVTETSVGSVTLTASKAGKLAIDSGQTLTTTATGTTLTMGTGTTLTNDGTLSLSGTTFGNSGTLTNASGSLVTYTGQTDDSAVTMLGDTYDDLTVNNSGTIFTQGGTTTINDDFTITAGTYSLNGTDLTVSAGSTTFANNDTIRLQGGETVSNLTMDTDSGLAEYVGTSTYTGLKLGNSYYNLKFNGSGGTWTLNNALDVNGLLTLSAGTLDVSASNYGITVGGGWTDTGSGAFTERSGIVTFDGTGTVNANEAFNSVTINASGNTVTLGAALDVNGTLTLTAGTLDVSASNYGITVATNWANGGGNLTGRNGTVTLDGTDQAISGSTTFYNLTKTVSSAAILTFTASTTQTVTGTWSAQGALSNLLSLRSSSTNTQWNINPTSYSVQFIDIKDSHNTSGTNISCTTGCVNSGNNTGWVFPWTGTVYTDEGVTNGGASISVALSINGAAAAGTATTDSSGAFSISLASEPVAGDVLTFYVDGHASIKAVTVTVTDTVFHSGFDLYQNRLIVRHDNSGALTNINLATADNNGDSDISALYSLDGSNNLTVVSGKELFIWTGKTFTPGSTVTVDDIDINGTFTMGANAVTVSGTWDATGGTFTGSNSVTLTSTATETITSNSNNFNNLTFNGSGGLWNLQDALRVTGALLITQGSLDLNGSNFNNTSGTFSNNDTLRLQGSETLTGFTNDTDSGTTLFDGTGTYSSLSGLTNFNHLTFNGSGGTWTLAAAIDVNGILTLAVGTLDTKSSSNYGITVAGGWVDTGAGVFNEQSGTVTFDGTGTLNSNEAFNSVTINGSGITVTLGNTLDVNGNLGITAGTLDVSGSNYGITVAGNWTNNGTFTQRSGTVTLDGGNQTLAGTTTFYNLTKTTAAAATLTFTAGTTQTVGNTWTAQGASGQVLSLRSSSNGTQWSINPQGTRTLAFIDVKDSNNSNATVILCTSDCTNSSNNSNWAFPIAVTVYSDEGSTLLGPNKKIAISVNGGTKTTATTGSDSIASFTTVGLSPGDIVTIWLDDETQNGGVVSVTNATSLGFPIYQNRLILQHEQGSGITNSIVDTADNSGDDDLTALYTLSGGALTVSTGIELYINSGDTFIPGGAVTVDDIDINGTFTMGANDVTLSGSWDATGGTFTGTNTVTFNSSATETVVSNGNAFNDIVYSLSGSGQVSNTDAMQVNGTQTVRAAVSSGGSDTTAPTISSVEVVPGETQASISWTTNESADSKVNYGTSGSLGDEKTDSTQTVRHAVIITGLVADTSYSYQVTSVDSSNNSASSSSNTFTTLKVGSVTDTTAPTISGITVSDVTSSSAVVTWITNENVSSSLDYGESTVYNRGATAGTTTTLTKTHSVTLVGLSPSTTYHYRVVAIDAAGNIGTSSDQTLATSAEEAAPKAQEVFQQTGSRTSSSAPTLTSEAPAITQITRTSAVVSWTTDKKSTSIVYYRKLNSSDEPTQQGSTVLLNNHSVKINGLQEGTAYEYSIESKDAEGGKVRSKRYQLTTTLPEAKNVVIENIADTSASFLYQTDSATQTIVKLINLTTGEAVTVNQDDFVLEHKLALDELDPNTKYQAVVLIRGPDGSLAESLAYVFETRLDKLDPLISSIETRSALIEGQRDIVQTVMSWKTNEPSTSQIFYNQDVSNSNTFKLSTEENKDFVTKHVMVLSDLSPSTVYQYKVRSLDKAGNPAESEVRVLLTPQRRVSAFDLIIQNLEDTFGWARRIR